jgi:hypothetical protein
MSLQPKKKYKNATKSSKEIPLSTKHALILHKPLYDHETQSEIESVAKLEFWYSKKDSETLRKINSARSELLKKVNKEDIVELTKIKRKGIEIKDFHSKEISKYFQNYEEECMNLYRNTQDTILENTEKRDGLRTTIIEIKNEINQYTQKLTFIKNSQTATQKIFLRTGMKQGNLALYLSTLETARKNLESEKIEVIQNIEMLEIELKSKNKEIKDIENTLEDLRKNFRAIKNCLVEYYSQNLREGNDPKGNGLHSIVKNLLDFGVEVKPAMFPAILDQESIDCILKITEKIVKIHELSENLTLSRSGKSFSNAPKQDIHNRLADLSKTIRFKHPNNFHKSIKTLKSSLELESFDNYVQLDCIRNAEIIKNIKAEIFEMQVCEIKRITKDFTKTGCDIKTICSHIVGKDMLDKFMIIIRREIQNIQHIKDQLKTFNFSSKSLNRSKKSFTPRFYV